MFVTRPKGYLIPIILAFTASSLFALFAPEKPFSEDKEESENETTSFYAHPLSGFSDNVLICGNDNSELHEIYLCGTTAERLITTNISDLQSITWSKLSDTQTNCNVTPNCPRNSPGCNWDELSTDTQYNVTQSGEYRIVIRYSDNTTDRFYFNVYTNGLDPSTVVTNIDCGAPGSITINNVPSAYEYSINNGATWQTSNVFSISSVSTYDVLIRRINETDGCLFTLDDIPVNNNAIDAFATVLPITCNSTLGSIQIDVNNASSTYVYKISQGGNLIGSSGPISDSSYTFSDLDGGTSYDINVTLASISACSWVATQTVPQFVNVQPEAVVTKSIDCTDGIITVTKIGGVAPFAYSITGGASFTPFTSGNQTTIPISTNGTYTVRVQDASGCEIDSESVTVSTQPEITVDPIVPQNISCNSTNDGSITVNVGNTQGHSISYSIDGGANFQTSNVFSNLAANTYSIIIRKQKAGGTCDLPPISNLQVAQSPPFSASASVTQQIDCNNGQANITANVTTGGVAPFKYSLDGNTFQASQILTGLGPGKYTITVRDSNQCLTTVDQTVNAGSNPSDLTFLKSGVDCATGATDVQVTVQNGTAPFTYRITAPISVTAPDDTFTALAPNTYTFEVTTDDGCKIIRNYVVPNQISFTSNALVKNNVSCTAVGTADGLIELSVDNFNTSFDVVVENSTGTPLGLGLLNQTTSPILISSLAADTYTIKINDESGPCQKIETATISGPPSALAIDSFSVGNMNCGTSGSVTIEASGGWGNYRYSAQQPDNTITALQSNKTITGLTQPGQYTIRVTDANGCLEDSVTFNLIDQGGPTATVDLTASNYCYSTTTMGTLKIDVTAGEAPYFYTVNNGTPQPITGGTFTLSDLTPEDYIIKVIGDNGCETTVTNTKISGQLFALAEITKPLGCGTTPDAIIDVTPQEGYPPYKYSVNSGSGFSATTVPFNASTAGSYTFEITDDKGCSFTTEPVNIVLSPTLTSTYNVSDTACGKAGTGSVELIANGGTPPYLYSFDGSPFTTKTLYTDLNAITYSYSIRDDLGCELSGAQATVGAEAAISADVVKTSDISCVPPPGSGTQWGNININNVQNATGLVNIQLIRVKSEANYLATGWSRTYRDYPNIDMATKPSGFDIRMYWPNWFFVRIEDEKGCTYESQFFQIEQPILPWIDKFKPLDQTCANGATFEFEVGDPTNLVGPFRVRLWPYDIESSTNGQYLPFDDPANLAYDPSDPANERDYKFTGLLFGVDYSVVILDEATGCVRWRYLGRVNEPVAPNSGFDVISTPQSLSCSAGSDGKVKFTVSGSGDNNLDGTQTVNWRIYNASSPSNTAFQQNDTADDGGLGGDIEINLTGLKRAWYVVEVTNEAGCISGNRFLVYSPKSKLKIELNQYVSATCNVGAQIAIKAFGGWEDQAYFNKRNKLDQASWHEFEYAYVVDGTDPATLPASEWSADTFKEITPSAYDGINNVYQVYVRDGGGCIAGLATPITITKDAVPTIDKIDVTNRCTSTDEVYDVVATLLNPGTNSIAGTPSYIWDGEVTTSANKQLGPGNHTLEVRDENGCSDTRNIHIYPQMVPLANIIKTVDCDLVDPNGTILASAYGGSGSYSFTLDPIPASYSSGEETNNTGEFNRLLPGIPYNVTVTDIDPTIPSVDRCAPKRTTTSILLETPAIPAFFGEVVQQVSCPNDANGIIRVLQQPGVDNLDVTYEYSLDGITYQASNIFSDLAPGIYSSINVRSSKKCIQSIPNLEITEPKPLAIGAIPPPTFSCTPGNNLGMATIVVSPSEGTMPYKYSFDGSSFTDSNTYEIPYLTTARTIVIDVVDANNCTDQASYTIPAATKLSATISTTTPMTCVTDGVYQINVDPSFTNISVSELPGASSLVTLSGPRNTTVTILAGNPNTYSFLVTDLDTGCTKEITQVVAPFDTIEISATHGSDIICHNADDGTLDFTVTGFGSSGFSYEVFLADGTSEQASVGPEFSTSALKISSLPPGTYYVQTTDIDTGCTAKSEFISIQSPTEPLDFSIATTQVLTCNGADAQITLTPVGGWGTYLFEVVETVSGNVIQGFNDPTNTNIIDNLTGISYQVRVKDAGQCISLSKSINITPIDPIVIDESTDVLVTNPNCPGASDGEIRMVVSRVNGPTNLLYSLTNLATGVTYLPQSGTNTITYSGLSAGSYSVKVEDDLNCFDITDVPIVLVDPFILEIDAAITQEPTCTPNAAQITVSATGNIGDVFEYQLIRPTTHPDAGIWVTSNIFGGLGPETYEFKARNQFNCESPISVIRTINVVDPFVVTIDESNTTINCYGESDAVLVAQAAGGLGGYQYQLEFNGTLIGVPQDSGIFENLGAGTYDIQATSGVDCVALNSQKIVISNPQELIVPPTVTATPVACFGAMTGSVTIPATGEAPFNYYISTEPQKAYSSNTFENLTAGNYTVIVQDVNGCEKETSFTVSGPSAPLATQQIRIVDEVCSNDDNGLIEYTITGGTPPYSYAIGDNPSVYSTLSGTTLLLDNLDGGFYEIFVKDANDCEADLIFEEVKVGSNLAANIETLNECKGGAPFYTASVIFEDDTLNTDEIVFDLDDANPNNPDVNDSQSMAVFENISAGNHTISIVHLGTGCVEVQAFNIEAQVPLTLTSLDGTFNEILVEANGGDGNYTYYFEDTPSSSNSNFINQDGNYLVRVVDGNGCEVSIEVPMEFIDIEIPNFFTPDGDGYKDKWIIENSEAFPDIYVRIYDRYGRTIKEFIGQGEWDGSYNKIDLPTGDYWYVIKLNGVNDLREFVGNVTVYR